MHHNRWLLKETTKPSRCVFCCSFSSTQSLPHLKYKVFMTTGFTHMHHHMVQWKVHRSKHTHTPTPNKCQDKSPGVVNHDGWLVKSMSHFPYILYSISFSLIKTAASTDTHNIGLIAICCISLWLTISATAQLWWEQRACFLSIS